MIRDEIKAALSTAMKGGDKAATGTIRLIQAQLKNRDIELRGKPPQDDDLLVTEVLQKMIKQRRESIALYEQGGRAELAAAETAEVAVIEGFLPRQMSEAGGGAAVDALAADAAGRGRGSRRGSLGSGASCRGRGARRKRARRSTRSWRKRARRPSRTW